MDARLKDKVAIVTGGARGIGAAFCEGLAATGAKVGVSDVLDGNPVAERIAETQKRALTRAASWMCCAPNVNSRELESLA